MDSATILIIDDDPTTRLLMRGALSAAGFTVEEASDGAAGLEVFQRLRPDLVLTDAMMPEMDGFGLCRAIRALPGDDRVPILMATSLEDLESINRAYEAGATDFVTKPLNWSLLPHRVRYMVRTGRTYRKLRVSQARNQALLDVIPDLLCRIDEAGAFLELRRSSDMVMIPEDRDLSALGVDDVFPPEIARRLLNAASRVLRGEGIQDLEFEAPVDGQPRQCEARIVESGAGEVLLILRDITRRKVIEEQLRTSEERFRSLIENASDMVTILDPAGIIEYGSPAMERVLGSPYTEWVGTPVFDLMPAEDMPRLRNSMALAAAEPGSPHAETFRFRDAAGEYRIMEAICSGLRDPVTRAMTVVLNGRDVTERIVAENALRHSEDQLRHSQKMEAIGRLAGGVAHDFNNLLTAILGYSQIVKDRLVKESIGTEDIDEIRKAGTRASSLTRQLLTFSRKQIMQPQVVDLNEITRDMQKLLKRLLGEDVQLATRMAPDLHSVLADPGQIEQVIMNLAVNARDAMPRGGVLTVETGNVTLDEDAARSLRPLTPGDYVLLTITDTGMGMDEETRTRVFEPFFTTKDEGRGTGLGLSTVYGIVSQCRGTIDLQTAPEQGTSFRVYLPRTDQSAAAAAAVTCYRPDQLRGNETVLLVEDEEWVRTLVQQSLEQHGYSVLSAADGQDALRIHERYKGAIHLLLTDVVMPRLGGIALAEQLHSLRPDTRWLYISGYTDHDSLRDHPIHLGQHFLQKPFTIEDLLLRVRAILDSPRLPVGVH